MQHISEVKKMRDFKQDETAEVLKSATNLLQLAVDKRASDIHLEWLEMKLRVRFRVDGVLQEVAMFKVEQGKQLISYLKVQAELDITEKRLPQDGRFERSFGEAHFDFRISTLPTLHGEKMQLRLLEKNKRLFTLEELEFSPEVLQHLQELLKLPQGMILLTGPTGSGKTTTLYAMLQKINSIEKNIITIEEPIEYVLAGVNQVAVHEKIGLSFASILKSCLRQDPDVILIGEIRDAQSAQIAVRAALTGHLVLATLHTNYALGAIPRLLDLGIEPLLLSEALRCLVAQRLVRRLCTHCVGEGCKYCGGFGYFGRLAVQEAVFVNKSMQAMIAQGASQEKLQQYVQEQGGKTLYEDCLAKIAQGKTTMQESLKTICFEEQYVYSS